jgi:uncharacterized membrane protein
MRPHIVSIILNVVDFVQRKSVAVHFDIPSFLYASILTRELQNHAVTRSDNNITIAIVCFIV